MPQTEFGRINSSIKNLLDNNAATKLTIKRTTASGIVVKNTTTSGAGLTGVVKVTVKDKAIGELTFEGDTAEEFSSKAKLTKLADNLVVKLEHSVGPKSEGLHIFGTDFVLSQPRFDVQAKVKVTQGNEEKKPSGALEASIVGTPSAGVTAAVQVKASLFPVAALKDYNVALSYTQGANKAVLVTEEKCQQYNLWLSHQYTAKTLVGGRVSYLSEKSANGGKREQVQLGVEHKLDQQITFKANATLAGVVKAQIKNTLSNPDLRVTFGASFTPTWRKYSADAVSLALALGDVDDDEL